MIQPSIVSRITALLMAGGSGERMRSSGSPKPKPLVPIRGVPLLERNLTTLLFSGFRDIIIAVPSHTPEIAHFANTRARMLGSAVGANINILEECQPYGNIGAAFILRGRPGDVLVVFADNLTELNLRALVSHHRQTGAALTLATHFESFQIPFGEIELSKDRVIAYREKPEHRIRVSSGTYVLANAALDYIVPKERLEVSQLINRLLDADLPVSAFSHKAAWIDVNDAQAIARAERLVATHAETMERWDVTPEKEVAGLVLREGHDVLIRRLPQNDPNQHFSDPEYKPLEQMIISHSDLPNRPITPGQCVEEAINELAASLSFAVSRPVQPLTTFDTLEPESGQVVRYHFFVADVVLLDSNVGAGTRAMHNCFARCKPLMVEHQAKVSDPTFRAIAALRDLQ